MQLSNLKVLYDNEISKIHEATLQILSETGINIDSKRAMKLMIISEITILIKGFYMTNFKIHSNFVKNIA